jgi:hypothetical protein
MLPTFGTLARACSGADRTLPARFRAWPRRLIAIVAAAAMLPACTHAFQTSGEALPDRMKVGEFSFNRPQGQGWYLNNVSDPPTIIEFTRHGHRYEEQIIVIGLRPDGRVTTSDELMEWAQNLPDADKVVTAAPGHGATCVRYHGRSTFTVHSGDKDHPIAEVMRTDEDSLECIDPFHPGLIVRFITVQRSAEGGTPEGTEEAYAFLKSVRFESQ